MTFIDTLVYAAMGAEGEHAAVAVALAIDKAGADADKVSRTIPDLNDAFCRPYLATQRARHDALRDAFVGCLFWLTNLKSATTAERFFRIMALLWVPEIYGDDRMREMMLEQITADARAIIYEAKVEPTDNLRKGSRLRRLGLFRGNPTQNSGSVQSRSISDTGSRDEKSCASVSIGSANSRLSLSECKVPSKTESTLVKLDRICVTVLRGSGKEALPSTFPAIVGRPHRPCNGNNISFGQIWVKRPCNLGIDPPRTVSRR